MSARPWSVQMVRFEFEGDLWSRTAEYSTLERAKKAADADRKWYGSFGQGHRWRILNRDTAEVIHIETDGHSVTDAPVRIDTRTESDIQADLAADREEAARDRQWADR